VFLLVDRFTLERFGDTAGRLLAVKARTAHVRFGLTYTFMVQAVVGISKLNTSAVEIESGSDFGGWRSDLRSDFRLSSDPAEVRGRVLSSGLIAQEIETATTSLRAKAG
jgi:hypothetical protein